MIFIFLDKEFFKKIKVKHILILLIIIILSLFFAMTNAFTTYYIINPTSGEKTKTQITDFNFSDNKIKFSYQDILYSFELNEYYDDTPIGEANYLKGKNSNYICSLIEYKKNLLIKITAKSSDINNSFILIVAKNHYVSIFDEYELSW